MNDLYLLAINLTQRCNLVCQHCYLDATTLKNGSANELTTAEVCALLDDVAARSDETMVVLTGGEPLLRGDLEQLVAHGASKKLSMVLGTNASLLTRKRAQSLQEAGLLGVGISIDSLDAMQHDSFRGVPGSWQRSMQGIEHCRELDLSFQIHFTVTDRSAHEIDDMIAFCRDKGARVFNVFFLICTGRADTLSDISPQRYEEVIRHLIQAQADYPDLIIRPRCAPHYKRIAHQLAPDSSINRISGQEGDGCIAASHYLRITPLGEVTPCPYIEDSVGSIRQQSLMSIWDNAPLLQALRNPTLNGKCGSCEYQLLCGGCRARPRAQGGSLFDEDPWCSWQPQVGNTTDEQVIPAIIQPWCQQDNAPRWNPEAERRIQRIPGFLRKIIRKRVEAHVMEIGDPEITAAHLDSMIARRFGDNKPKRPFFVRKG